MPDFFTKNKLKNNFISHFLDNFQQYFYLSAIVVRTEFIQQLMRL